MAGATTPMHALPWYFGLSVFGVWAAAAVALGLLVRRRIRARADRRADRRVPGAGLVRRRP